jgi:hypothetical protein
MNDYEQTMEAILKQEIKERRAKVLTKEHTDGFEFRIKCSGCEYAGSIPFQGPVCSHNIQDTEVSKINGGEICNDSHYSKGRCFRFVSFDEFWDNTDIFIQETGEIICL